MTNIWKRSLSMFLALVMVFGMLPMNVFAADDEGTTPAAVMDETPTEPQETEKPTDPPHTHSYTYECSTVCADCGEGTREASHSYAEGKCAFCGAEDPDYVPAHEHSYAFSCATECMTCTEGTREAYHSYMEGKCEFCGKDEPAPVEPTPSEPVVKSPAPQNEPGEYIVYFDPNGVEYTRPVYSVDNCVHNLERDNGPKVMDWDADKQLWKTQDLTSLLDCNCETFTIDFGKSYVEPATIVEGTLENGKIYDGPAPVVEPEVTYVAQIGEEKFETLEAAMKACAEGNNTITLLDDSAEVFTFTWQSGVNITIDGNDQTFSGQITFSDNAGGTFKVENATLLADAQKFAIVLSGKQAPNITLENCTLTSEQTASDYYGSKGIINGKSTPNCDIVIRDCAVSNLYYTVYFNQGGKSLLIEDCEITDCVYLSSVQKCDRVTIKNVTYSGMAGILAKNDTGTAKLNIENTSINVTLAGQVPVSVIGTGAKYEINLTGENVMTQNGEELEGDSWLGGSAASTVTVGGTGVVNPQPEPEKISGNITEDMVWNDGAIVEGVTISDDVTITVNGTVTVNGTINMTADSICSVTFNGENNAKLIRGESFTGHMFLVIGVEGKFQNLTINDITLDGGAVWTGNVDQTLNRGKTNEGVVATATALDLRYANATLNRSVLQNHDNASNGKASAVYLRYYSSVEFNNSIVRNNNSQDSSNGGGVISARQGATVKTNNAEVYGNSGGQGGFYGTSSSGSYGGKVEVYNSKFHNNYADTGAVFDMQCNSKIGYLLIDGCEFYENAANRGLIYEHAYSRPVTIKNSYFHDNECAVWDCHTDPILDLSGKIVVEEDDDYAKYLFETPLVLGGALSEGSSIAMSEASLAKLGSYFVTGNAEYAVTEADLAKFVLPEGYKVYLVDVTGDGIGDAVASKVEQTEVKMVLKDQVNAEATEEGVVYSNIECLPVNPFAHEGLTFAGWVDADGKAVAKQKFTETATLTATWAIETPVVKLSRANADPYCNTLLATVTNKYDNITYTYQWYKADVAINGATEATYEITETDSYKCVVTASFAGLASVTGSASGSATFKVEPVAVVNGTDYGTLAAAVAAANAIEGGATITLLKDVTLGEKLTISGNVTISGEKTITRADSYTGTLFTVNSGATLTLDGGLVIDGANNYAFDTALYNADLEARVSIPATDAAKYFTPVNGAPVATAFMITTTGGTVNLNKVTVQNNYSNNSGVISAGANSTISLTGAKITHCANVTNSGLAVNASGANIKVTMNDGTVIDGNHVGGNHGIFKIYSGTVFTMKGGEVKNTTGWNSNGTVVGLYSGTFIMNGGTICSNSSVYGPNNGRNAAIYLHSNSVMEMNGGTICHDTGLSRGGIDSSKATSKLTITGGEVLDNISLAGYTTPDVGGTVGTWSIYGGTFTQDVSAWMALGYGLAYDEAEGVYTVTDDLAAIGEVVYKSVAEAAKAAKDGDIITVLASYKASETAVIDKNVKLDLNGKTINGYTGVNPIIRVLADVTVTGNGMIDSANQGDGYCFIVGNGEGVSGNLTIENGTFKGTTTAISVTKGTATLLDGDFRVKPYENSYAYLLNCIDANYKDGSAKIVVKGGVFTKFNPANNAAEGAGTNFVADGYKTVAEGDYYTVSVDKDALPAIATITFKNGAANGNELTLKYPSERFNSIQQMIGTNNYADFVLGAEVNELLAYAAQGNATDIVMTLHADVVLEDTLYFYDKYFKMDAQYDLTLDLNGHTITVADTMSNKPAIRVLSNVTVKNGTIDATAGTSTYAFIVGQGENEGKLTIVDGTYKGTVSAVSITKGTANITGGNFEATPYEGKYEFLLNCIDGNYKNGTAVYNITGGTFKGFNPANNAAEGANTNFCANGYIAEELTAGYFTVRQANYVAEVNGTKYESLQAAINACVAGENTIVLLDNNDETVTIKQTEGVNITINGDGKYMSGTIKIDGNGRPNGAETLTIQNVNFKKTDATTYAYFIDAETNSAGKNSEAHNVTIDGCTFESTNWHYAIGTRNPYNLVVKNSEANKVYYFIYNPQGGHGITVEDCTVTNATYGIGAQKAEGVSVKNYTYTGKAAGFYGRATSIECNTVLENVNITTTLNGQPAITLWKNDDNTTSKTYTFNFKGENVLTTPAGVESFARQSETNSPYEIKLVDAKSTLKASADLGVTTDVADHIVVYENDTYKVIPNVKVTVTVQDVSYVEGNPVPTAFTYTTDIELDFDLDIEYTVNGTAIDADVEPVSGYEFIVVPGTLTVQKALVRVYGTSNAKVKYFVSFEEAMEYAVDQNDYVPIYLLESITVNETIVVADDRSNAMELQGVKLGGNTLTLKSTFDGPMFKMESGKLSVKNLKIDAYGDAFYVTGGELNLNYHSKNSQFIEVTSQTGNCVYTRGGTVNVNGAKLTALGEYPAIQGNGGYAGNVTLNKWNIGDGTYPEISAPNTDIAIYWPQNGTLTIEGGKITGKTALYAKSGTIVINGGEFIADGAKVDFAHNSNGASATGDAVVIESCKDPAYETPSVTISGGTFTSAHAEAVMFYDCAGKGDKGAEVMELKKGGIYSSKPAPEWCAPGCFPGQNADGTWSIKDVVTITIHNQTMVAGNALPTFTYDIEYKDIEGLDIEFYVDGNTAVAGEYTIKANVSDANNAYVYNVIPGTLTVQKALVRAYAANNAKVKYFTSLNEALEYAASNNDYVPVTILGDITVDETIVFNDKVANTIELQGGKTGSGTYTVTATADPFIKMEAGRLSIKNLRINTKGDSFYVTGGELSLNYHSVGKQFIEVTSQTGNCVYTRGGTVNVNGAKLTSLGAYPAIQGNGGYAGNVTLNKWNIGDGTYPEISAPNTDIAIYWPQNGTLTIEGGKITGKTALYAKSGTIVINGGEFIADGAKVDFAHNSNGAYATGDAVVIESCKDAAYETPVVTVTGGTFTSANAKAFAVYNCNANAPLTKFISGGVFNTDVDDALPIEGHRDTENADGTWTIKKIVKITLNNQEFVVGNTLDTTKWTWEHDNATEIEGLDVTFDTTKVDLTVPGTYPITATVKDTADYSFDVVGATLTVKAAVCAINDVNYATLNDAVKSVAKGVEATIKLLVPELKVNSTMVGHQYAQKITIDLNGGKIYSTEKTLTAYRGGTVLTLTNGTVSGNTTGGTLVATYGGKLVLGENLTVTAGNKATAIKVDNGTLVVDAENVKVQAGTNWLVATDHANNRVNISNGDFTGGMSVAAKAILQLSGGFYDVEPEQKWCVEGYSAKRHGADRWTVGKGLITVDGKWFDNFDAAKSSIKKNSEIVLYGDVYNTYNGGGVAKDFQFPVSAGTIKIDLNGHKFSSEPTDASKIITITIPSNTTVVFNDSFGGGVVHMNSKNYPLVLSNAGKVVFNDDVQFIGNVQFNRGGNLFVKDVNLIGLNGIYQIEGITRITVAETGDWTLASGKLTLTEDDATLAQNTLTINKGYTFDLAGYNLTAKNIVAFGELIDSKDGVGTVTVPNDGEYYYTNHANGDYLPLYDTTNGCYRLYKTEVKTRGVKAVTANTLKYGYTIYFNVAEAYKLLAEMVESNQFSMVATWSGNETGFTYDFSDALLAQFAEKAYEQLVQNGTVKASMTLGINGMETLSSGDIVTTVPSVSADIGVIVSGAPHNYAIS